MLFYIGIMLIPLFIVMALLYLFFSSQKRKSKAVARVEDEDLGTERIVSRHNSAVHQQRATDPNH